MPGWLTDVCCTAPTLVRIRFVSHTLYPIRPRKRWAKISSHAAQISTTLNLLIWGLSYTEEQFHDQNMWEGYKWTYRQVRTKSDVIHAPSVSKKEPSAFEKSHVVTPPVTENLSGMNTLNVIDKNRIDIPRTPTHKQAGNAMIQGLRSHTMYNR